MSAVIAAPGVPDGAATSTRVALARVLPAFWDGRPVTWDAFTAEPRMFICDRSKRKNGLHIPTCDVCGHTGPKLRATGLRQPAPGASEPGEYLRLHRNGTPVYAQEPAPAYRDLHATRCPECGHDQVYDMATGEAWDLDDTDYGPDGSAAP